MRPQIKPKVRAFLNTESHTKTLIGHAVMVQYYNTPDKKFYGPVFEARIIGVNYNHKTGKTPRPYKVEGDSLSFPIWIAAYEIRGMIT